MEKDLRDKKKSGISTWNKKQKWIGQINEGSFKKIKRGGREHETQLKSWKKRKDKRGNYLIKPNEVVLTNDRGLKTERRV
jgi:hypothetical protein